jgi:hypothetical protein
VDGPQGGYSLGSIRQAHRVRLRYRMPLMTARMSTDRADRPARPGDQRLDQRVLLVREVARVWSPFHPSSIGVSGASHARS